VLGFERSLLDLQEDRSGLEAENRMPGAGRDLYAILTSFGVEVVDCRDMSRVVEDQ
jgi:hypothetical protein